MPMILILDRDLTHPKFEGLIVSCNHCQRATDRDRVIGGGWDLRDGEHPYATCDVLRIRVDLEVRRICSSFEERH